jgi:hypothetical protein
METKPYSLQSPEAIAKEYAGNKQKIAQAMQMGLVDPTAGVLAGMFIDRMRSAQMQEMTPQPTVAQQVMGGAPQAPVPPSSGGLGMTQPAQPPMAPQGGVGMAPPPQAPVPGMAAGGLYDPPYMAGGGLSEIPLPDTMFDEDRSGSYAGGGIIAFNPGGEVEETIVTAREEPESIFGIYRDPELNKTELIEKLYKPQRKYGEKLTSFYEDVMSPEAQKQRKKEDLWTSLAELGFGMAASKSPTLFGAIGEAGMRAAPNMAARGKERRAEQRDAIKTLAQQEGFNNKEALEIANASLSLTGKYGDYRGKQLDRDQQLFIQKMQDATQRYGIASQAASSRYAANASAAGADKALQRDILVTTREAGRYYDALTEESPKLKRMKMTDPVGYTQAKMQYIKDYVYGPQ